MDAYQNYNALIIHDPLTSNSNTVAVDCRFNGRTVVPSNDSNFYNFYNFYNDSSPPYDALRDQPWCAPIIHCPSTSDSNTVDCRFNGRTVVPSNDSSPPYALRDQPSCPSNLDLVNQPSCAPNLDLVNQPSCAPNLDLVKSAPDNVINGWSLSNPVRPVISSASKNPPVFQKPELNDLEPDKKAPYDWLACRDRSLYTWSSLVSPASSCQEALGKNNPQGQTNPAPLIDPGKDRPCLIPTTVTTTPKGIVIKSYVCDQCNKAFRHSQSLNRHKKIHSDATLYPCDQCNQAFRQSKFLNRHKKIHSDATPYPCDQCNKAFHRKDHLKQHKVIHTDDRPFQCTLCNQTFSRNNALQQHQSIHSSEKNFQCKTCNQQFARFNYLQLHKKIHTSVNTFQCECCGYRTHNKFRLLKHNTSKTHKKNAGTVAN